MDQDGFAGSGEQVVDVEARRPRCRSCLGSRKRRRVVIGLS